MRTRNPYVPVMYACMYVHLYSNVCERACVSRYILAPLAHVSIYLLVVVEHCVIDDHPQLSIACK